MAKIERLSGEFNRGYTRAIQDIQEIFKNIEDDLRYCHKKRLNAKIAEMLLDVILENRAKLREKREGFIRWNRQKQSFEWFCKGDE